MIAENIRRLREAKGMSRREFGEMLYVSQDVINNLERNRVEPTALMIKCICDTFHVTESWLETGEGEMFTQRHEDEKILASVNASPALQSMLAIWAQLSPENKAVFERYAADFAEDYQRRKAEAATVETQTMLDDGEADLDNADQKQA